MEPAPDSEWGAACLLSVRPWASGWSRSTDSEFRGYMSVDEPMCLLPRVKLLLYSKSPARTMHHMKPNSGVI